jgi:tetratricopeptide (TPR) repeat protein
MDHLMTLKSYMLLDDSEDEGGAFEKLTKEATEIFGVPTSLVSLIDLDRQFLFSNKDIAATAGASADTGDEIKKSLREVGVRAYTVRDQDGKVVVEESTTDVEGSKKDNYFSARAPVISPEGRTLGTFCIEGPIPSNFSEAKADQKKLKAYAAQTMAMIVERRKNLRDRLAAAASNNHLRHAAVATNLGDTMFLKGDSVTAMHLFQESIQTIMQSSDEESKNPCDDRHEKMVNLLKQLSEDSNTSEQIKKLMDEVKSLVIVSNESHAAMQQASLGLSPIQGLPGLFNSVTKMKGVSAPRPLPPMVFSETFSIDLSKTKDSRAGETIFPLDERPFTVSIGECTKATLYNMGLIHYNWCRPDTAFQFFHMAASVSHKLSPLQFDPVDLTSVGNMAQIQLLLRNPDQAMSMLQQTLKRANETLTAIYNSIHSTVDEDDEEALFAELSDDNDEAARKTRRLRRKIARTLLDIGHVHFFNNDLNEALASCKEALTLVDDHMTGVTRAAAWFNMSMILHHMGKNEEALACLNRFLEVAAKNLDKDHVQIGDALHLKGEILFDMGNLKECEEVLKESLRVRRGKFGDKSGILVETLEILGKAQIGMNQVDDGIKSLEESLSLEQTSGGSEMSFEAAQCLLDLARGYQVKGDMESALAKYLSVIEWSRNFFGPKHAFTGRIASLVGNIYAQTGMETESKKYLQEANEILSAA